MPLSLEVRRVGFNPLLHGGSIRDEMERRRAEMEDAGAAAAAPFTPFRSRVQQQRRAAAEAEAVAIAQKRKFPAGEVPEVIFPEDVSVCESEAGAAAADSFPPSAAKRSRTVSPSFAQLPDLSPAGKERLARFKSRKESILSILQTPKVVKKGRSKVTEQIRNCFD